MLSSGRWMRNGSTIVVMAPNGAGVRRSGSDNDLSNAELFELEGEAAMPQLRRGAKGSSVTELQTQLKARGFDPGAIDGVFGSMTESAVRAFQAARGLAVDGIVGPQTWGALAAAPPAPAAPAPRAPSTYPGGHRRAVHLQVPFRGYQSNDTAGCFRRSSEMAAAVGVTVGGPDVRIQVAVAESSQGRVTIDHAKAREGLAYIDAQLDIGRPVVVGVSYKDDSYNVDAITDHFVIITGRDTESDGDLYYTFHDPASSQLSKGGDQNAWNRFYVAPQGGLFRPGSSSAPLGSYTYDLAMVRRNV